MISKENNPLLRLYEEVINQGNLEVLDELYTPDYVNHAAPFGLSKGLDGLKQLFAMFIEAFPDQNIVADDMIIERDKIVARWTLRATHKGTFVGTAATNKQVVMTGIDIERIVDGKIAEHWGGEDMLGLLEQIGAVPRLQASRE